MKAVLRLIDESFELRQCGADFGRSIRAVESLGELAMSWRGLFGLVALGLGLGVATRGEAQTRTWVGSLNTTNTRNWSNAGFWSVADVPDTAGEFASLTTPGLAVAARFFSSTPITIGGFTATASGIQIDDPDNLGALSPSVITLAPTSAFASTIGAGQSVTLAAGGTLANSGPFGSLSIAAGGVLQAAEMRTGGYASTSGLVQGGANGFSIANLGTIQADSTDVPTDVNGAFSGTADPGTLTLNNVFVLNSGAGAIRALGGGSVNYAVNGSVTGGTLGGPGATGAHTVVSGGYLFDGITLAASTPLDVTGSAVASFANSSSILGTVTNLSTAAAGLSLSSATLTGSGTLVNNASRTTSGSGTLSVQNVTNGGTIEANGGSLGIQGTGNGLGTQVVSNAGGLLAASGGTLAIGTQYDATLLTGGSTTISGGTLRAVGGNDVEYRGGDINPVPTPPTPFASATLVTGATLDRSGGGGGQHVVVGLANNVVNFTGVTLAAGTELVVADGTNGAAVLMSGSNTIEGTLRNLSPFNLGGPTLAAGATLALGPTGQLNQAGVAFSRLNTQGVGSTNIIDGSNNLPGHTGVLNTNGSLRASQGDLLLVNVTVDNGTSGELRIQDDTSVVPFITPYDVRYDGATVLGGYLTARPGATGAHVVEGDSAFTGITLGPSPNTGSTGVGAMIVDPLVTATFSGTNQINGPLTNNGTILLANSGTDLGGTGSVGNASGLIEGQGTISVALVTAGTIRATTGNLAHAGGTRQGTSLDATGANAHQVTALTNLSAITLTSGTPLNVLAGTANFQLSSTIDGQITNSATVTLQSATLGGTGAYVGNPGSVLNGAGTAGLEVIGDGSILPTGAMVLGDSTSPIGYDFGGTLVVGSHNVTLNDADWAQLGVLTTVAAGGSLSAPNAFALSTGDLLTVAGGGGVVGDVFNGGTVQLNGTLSGNFDNFVLGRLEGGGSITGDLDLQAGSTLAPGNSPGALAVGGSAIFAGGATYEFEINQAASAIGLDPGWDWLSVSGTINITATPTSRFVLDLRSLSLANAPGNVHDLDALDHTTSYDWVFATGAGGIVGFDPAKFLIDIANFSHTPLPLGAGHFSVLNVGNDLILHFAPVPEPGSLLIWAGLAGLGGWRLWRRRRTGQTGPKAPSGPPAC